MPLCIHSLLRQLAAQHNIQINIMKVVKNLQHSEVKHKNRENENQETK